ncbi:MAG: Holliday junction branch migration protein RuvA [Patescibacteria group bacterium]|nr:Holliday junction branch migration protein RuvA [Patescibacteria group bacterium]
MISSLKGNIIHKFLDSGIIVIEVNGVGYGVYVRTSLFSKFKEGEGVFLFAHEYIRENSRELYGFLKTDELKLFEKLLSVSGVGPKLALNILSLGKIEDIKKSIDNDDVEFLTTLKGVGKKIAQKIILELKGKLIDGKSVGYDDEVVDALKNLGYSFSEAKTAIGKIPKNLKTTELRLRETLKHLAR